MNESLTFVRGGKRVPREEVSEAPIIVAGSDLPDETTAHVFDTDKELLEWARGTDLEEKLTRMQQAAKTGREYKKNADLSLLEAWQKKKVKRIIDDLNELAQYHNLPVNSIELLRKATIEADSLMGPIFDSWVLYDNNTCSSRDFRPITGLVPRFGWIDFNNKASSAQGWLSLTLYSQYWFDGRRVMILNKVPACVDLADFNFVNVASSAIAGG